MIPVTPELFELSGKYGCGPGLDIFLRQNFLEWLQLFGHLTQGPALAYLFGFSWNREVFLKLPPVPFFFSFGYRIPFLAWIGTFQSLKLIGMWSLTIHPDCLMNFLAAASGAIGSPSGPTSVIMNRPSSFFVWPRFVFFCCDDDPDGYKKTFIVFI